MSVIIPNEILIGELVDKLLTDYENCTFIFKSYKNDSTIEMESLKNTRDEIVNCDGRLYQVIDNISNKTIYINHAADLPQLPLI